MLLQVSQFVGLFAGHLAFAGCDGALQVASAVSHALQRGLGFLHQRVGEVDGSAVLGGQQEVAQHLAVVFLQDVAHGEEVVERLAHLLVVDRDEPVVHPVVGELLAGQAFGLRDLVLVMRELQVFAAAVQVDGLAQELLAHGRAFDVPAGTSFAPGGIPGDLVGRLLRLPQGEVQRVALLFPFGDAGTDFQVLDEVAGQQAVTRELAGAVVHVAVHFVGQSLVDQALHERDDLGHGLAHSGVHVRRRDVQRLHVLEILVDIFVRNVHRTDVFLSGAVDDLVVHVREVLHVAHLLAAVLQVLSHGIEHDERTGVADMDEIIDGGTADVHLQLGRIHRHEFFFSAAHGVVDLHVILPPRW